MRRRNREEESFQSEQSVESEVKSPHCRSHDPQHTWNKKKVLFKIIIDQHVICEFLLTIILLLFHNYCLLFHGGNLWSSG